MRKEGKPREAYLLMCVRFLYDLMKVRIAMANRTRPPTKRKKPTNGEGQEEGEEWVAEPMAPYDAPTPEMEEILTYLTPKDKDLFNKISTSIEDFEKSLNSVLGRALKNIPIWETFLKGVKGIGPRMGSVLIAETNIEMCHTASQLWAWWGLAVRNGEADRRHKGEKLRYDPERKAKVTKVLAECLIKAKSPKYYQLYLDYKHRKTSQRVPTCACCEGKGYLTGKAAESHDDAVEVEVAATEGKKAKKEKRTPCSNCAGTGGPAPWGRSDAHRHVAARRYMVKQLLLDMWVAWRTLEGFTCPGSYAEVYLKGSHPGPGNAPRTLPFSPGGA
jgi:hypothetical protein